MICNKRKTCQTNANRSGLRFPKAPPKSTIDSNLIMSTSDTHSLLSNSDSASASTETITAVQSSDSSSSATSTSSSSSETHDTNDNDKPKEEVKEEKKNESENKEIVPASSEEKESKSEAASAQGEILEMHLSFLLKFALCCMVFMHVTHADFKIRLDERRQRHDDASRDDGTDSTE